MEFISSFPERYQRLISNQSWPTNFGDVVALMIGVSLASYILVSVFTWLWRQFSFTGTAAKRFLSMGYEVAEGHLIQDDMVNRLKRYRKVEEMLPPYPNGWFLLFQSDELTKGQSTGLSVCGLNLIAWRGESGKVHVADAYCTNSAANTSIAESEDKKEGVQCPFHGWEFEGTTGGEMPKAQTSTTEKVKKTHMHHVMEQDGLVYFWFHAEDVEPEWTPRLQAAAQGKDWKLRGFVETYVNSHMQDIPENQADVMHFNYLHGPGYISGYEPHNNAFSFLEFVRFEYNGKWRPHEDPSKKHVAYTPDVTVDMHLFGKYTFRVVIMNVTQEGPGITCFHFAFPGLGKWASTSAWLMTTPVEPMVQKLFMPTYSGPWVPSFFVTMVFEYFVVSIARDAAVWNRKSQLKNPILVKEDAGIKVYRGWINQFYTENSPRPDYFSSIEY
ncbi:unnamed protein product [Allacma fusca]|uniref:cholesterol 7-desaturase n=1 Tax=Allacma fusca TaxID=39272 RepID=A0A8J2PNZ8_9HEXA|nr:unnamed protein product [Allacma fusca]